jgi:hypothetical protein
MTNLSDSKELVNTEENHDVNSDSSSSHTPNTVVMLSPHLPDNSSQSNSSNNVVVNLNLTNNCLVNTLVSSSLQNENLNQNNDESAENNSNKANAKSTMFYSSSSRSSLTSPDSMKKSRQEEFHIFYRKCMKTIFTSINIIKAVMMRLIFSLHSFIAIVFVYYVKEDEWYLLNLVGVVFLQMELFITIIRRKGREPRWYFIFFF